MRSKYTYWIIYNMVLPRCVVVCNLLDFLLINEIQYRRYYWTKPSTVQKQWCSTSVHSWSSIRITEQNHLRFKNPIKRKRHPDEIKDRENYRRMKGIPVPNYTINKGILAENMATAAVEYPFTLAENMVGRPEEL